MYHFSMKMGAMEENNHVDTSRPFSSVKEAVATFGQRIMLPGTIHTLNSKPVSPSNSQTARPASPIAAIPSISQIAKPVSPIAASPRIRYAASLPSSPLEQHTSFPSPQVPKEEFMDVLKKLEAEITETKTEVRMLKERELETEVALAALNAELHKNMSKMAKTVADAAGKSADAMVIFKETKEKENGEEERRKEVMRRMQNEYISLAQILDGNKGKIDGYFGDSKKNVSKKKKPIVPLLGDFFFFKKKKEPLFTTSSTLNF